jgi:hypothetical protein
MASSVSHDKIDLQLREAWLGQLQMEFEDICFQYRLILQAPVFELTDSQTILGSWNAQHRLLSISAHLIRNCPWQTTLQVLKHEMAHQVCTDLFASDNGEHGRLFRQACGMLGLTGHFCRATADCTGIPSAMSPASSPCAEEGRRILSRVEKLLALAASDNEHEAALAMQRAGELLCRHNLSLKRTEDENYRHLCLNTGRQRMPGYLRDICGLLQEYFFVRVVCASVYEPARDIRLRTIELFGRPENVAVAEHCYHFLTGKLLALWQQRRRRFAGSGQRARTSYFHGIIVGFREKLAAGTRQQVKSAGDTGPVRSKNLVVTEDIRLQGFVANYFPRLQKGRGRKILLHTDAYKEAVATGKTLILHKVMGGAASKGGLLEEKTN